MKKVIKNPAIFFYPFPFYLLLLVSCANKEPAFDGTGSFIASEVIVSAEASGRIISLNVKEGDVLEQDQVIGLIDTTLIHLQKNQFRAQIESIQAGLPDVVAQTAYFDQQIDLARIQLHHLKSELGRIQGLHNVEAATDQQLDEVTHQVHQTQQQINILEAQKEAQVSALSSKKSGQEALSRPQYAQLALLEEQIRKSKIVNPRSGTVLRIYAETGEFTTPGKPLYRIADLRDVRLKAYIPGSHYAELKLGQQVTVHTDDGHGAYHSDTGTVIWISSKAEFTPKTVQTPSERENLVYAIEVSVPNLDGRYKIGMYGEVKL